MLAGIKISRLVELFWSFATRVFHFPSTLLLSIPESTTGDRWIGWPSTPHGPIPTPGGIADSVGAGWFCKPRVYLFNCLNWLSLGTCNCPSCVQLGVYLELGSVAVSELEIAINRCFNACLRWLWTKLNGCSLSGLSSCCESCQRNRASLTHAFNLSVAQWLQFRAHQSNPIQWGFEEK